jgi:hypothetical protein
MDKMIQAPTIYIIVTNIKGSENDHMWHEQKHQEQHCEDNFAIKDLLHTHNTSI